MYRAADPERKLRAGARRDELSERAKALLDEQRCGRVARAALIDALERLDVEDLATLERALDALEEAIAAFTVAAASESERADPFRLLGPPSADAEVFTESFSRFMFAEAPSASQRRAIVACLQTGAARWTKQMASAPLVDAHPDRLASSFEHEGVPLRLDIGVGELDDGDLYEKATLSGVVALGDGVRISVRPQTMGDDILASLRIRRDLTWPRRDAVARRRGDAARGLRACPCGVTGQGELAQLEAEARRKGPFTRT